jgi:hypothetical protein
VNSLFQSLFILSFKLINFWLFSVPFKLSSPFLLVLESWLDFTGELEPPDPLARLPQLKRHLKQLLLDVGKVQQIATLCSV